MKTDISRWSPQAGAGYSGVYQQQGRLISDADWNELMEVVKQQARDALKDVVGSGAPGPVLQGSAGQVVLAPQAVVYVDGVRAVPNPGTDTVALNAQPHYPLPAATAVPADAGFFLDVWERSVTALEDPALRDSALGGADTCTRTQTMAQVKWFKDDAMGFGLASYMGLTSTPHGCARLAATARTASPADRLLRLEVHDVDYNLPGGGQQLTLKWSDENAAMHFAVDDAPPPDFTNANAVFEFYTAASDKHLGINLAKEVQPLRGVLRPAYLPVPRDAASLQQLCPDPLRPEPLRVRRWDGFCRLRSTPQSGGRWELAYDPALSVDERNHAGKMGSTWLPVERAAGIGAWVETAGSRGVLQLVIQCPDLQLALTLTPRLQGELPFICGDYWLVQVRSEAEAPVTVLNGGAALGVAHHYLRLKTDAAGQPQFQFAPLTRIEDRLVHKAGDRMSGALAIDSGKHDDAEVLLDAKGTLAARGLKLQTGGSPPVNKAVLQYEAATGYARWFESALSAWTLNAGNLATDPSAVTGTIHIGPALHLAATTGHVGVGSANNTAAKLRVQGDLQVAAPGVLAVDGAITTSTLTSKSDVAVGGGLTVAGATTLAGSLTANGGVTTNALSVQGNVSVSETLSALHVKADVFSIGDANQGYLTVATGTGSHSLLIGGYGGTSTIKSVIFRNFKTNTLVDIEAKNVAVSSDARLKHHIQPLQGSLDRITRLRGVGFQWKHDPPTSAAIHLGLLAQEVMEVVPEVIGSGQDGHYLLDYSGLIPLLVEALKEQQAQITQLQAQVAALGKA
jgi:hypothetical protein